MVISLIAGLFVSFAIGCTASIISQGFQYGWDNINYLQAGIDGLFALVSTALAYTGIGYVASIALGAGLGMAQYTLDSAVFHNDFKWSGFITAGILGGLGGWVSGRGAQHFKSIGGNLDENGRYGVKALLTAFDKYGIDGQGYKRTLNLWGDRVNAAISKSISQSFTKTLSLYGYQRWGHMLPIFG